jgi:hypothetical protein
MQAPQIIVLSIYAIVLLAAAIVDGKEVPYKVSFKWRLVGSAIGLSLLYWGGFFD